MTSRRRFVLTVVHNRIQISEAFAHGLAKASLSDLWLVLVDDGSTDGTAQAVCAAYPQTIVLRGDGNLWWAGGLQKGLNWLAAQGLDGLTPVAIMNDDVEFDSDFVPKALAELETLPLRAFLVVPGVFYPSGRPSEEAGVTDWSRFTFLPIGDDPERVNYSSTRVLFTRWSDLSAVGGFHPTLLPHYTSDWEFTIRARRKGIRLVPARTVQARYNDLTTGDHRTGHLPLRKKLERLFSVRFSFNLPSIFMFIWYSCPWWAKFPCWARMMISAAKFLR